MKRGVVVGALGTAQTLAWGSSYYLPAILADPIADGLGLSRTVVFGVFSGSLLVSAFLGPPVGRAIDAHGGRGVLALSNLVLAAGLVLLALTQGVVSLVAAWTVLGVGMAMGLYDPAFAALAGLYGRAARGPITGITLIAGFASTVGWPLSALLEAHFGWRGACLVWAALKSLDWLTVEPAADPTRAAPGKGNRSGGDRRTGATRGNASSFVRVCRDLVRYRGDGGPSAQAHRNSRGERDGSDHRSGPGWTCASRGSPCRVRCAEAGAPGDLGTTRGGAASNRSCRADGDRAFGHHGLRGTAWSGERFVDHRQGHAASRYLWAGRLRAAQRDSRCTGARSAGGIAPYFRTSDRLAGCWRLGYFRGHEHCRSACFDGAQGADLVHGNAVTGVASFPSAPLRSRLPNVS